MIGKKNKFELQISPFSHVISRKHTENTLATDHDVTWLTTKYFFR